MIKVFTMRIAAGIGLVILFFVFFAQASIRSHVDTEPADAGTMFINSTSNTAILFHEEIVLENITIPAYEINRLAPGSGNWNSKTIEPIVNYLKDNNEKVLLISGGYLEAEKENSIGGFKSMGEARAGFIATQLVKNGISNPRIILRDRIIKSETLNTPLRFEFFNDGENIP